MTPMAKGGAAAGVLAAVTAAAIALAPSPPHARCGTAEMPTERMVLALAPAYTILDTGAKNWRAQLDALAAVDPDGVRCAVDRVRAERVRDVASFTANGAPMALVAREQAVLARAKEYLGP